MIDKMNKANAGASHSAAGPALAIIGGGQIGSRHLQALAQLDRAAIVHVVDPNPASLATSRSRFEEARPHGSAVDLSMHESFGALPPALDVAIIATSADVRLEVLRQLLEITHVKYLILEKVLFQREREVKEAARLLSATSTKRG